MRFIQSLLILVLAGAASARELPQWRLLSDGETKRAAPAHLSDYAKLPAGSVLRLKAKPAAKDGAAPSIELPGGIRHRLTDLRRIAHANGDVSFVAALEGEGQGAQLLMTVGESASFGSWRTPQGAFRFESWGDQGWLVDLSHPGIRVENADAGALGSEPLALPVAASGATKSEPTVIDVLFIYSDGFAARYPGSATQTRINHIQALGNQILSNSGLALTTRLAGALQTAYPDSDGSNLDALERMRDALAGSPTVSAFANLRGARDALGADVVSFLRPHDVETRGSCGIALFPNGEPARGVHVVSDGFSSWSLCGEDVFMHELGHNLGAEHQNGANSPNAGFGTAHVVPGRFHTLMGSFGTGHPDRLRGLARFSNPEQLCGGHPCGEPGVSDNARRIRELQGLVSSYRAPLPNAPAALLPAATDPDVDGDGVPESQDAFPFDPAHAADADRDGVPDELDAFPSNPAESADSDGDGIGDNADADADNDGEPNLTDAFPTDPTEQSDLDSDRVGDNSDAFPQSRSEWADIDADGTGDNADPDADGDGVPDLMPGSTNAASDLLVISAGTDRVLRFDARSGLFMAVEVAESHQPQALGQQSNLAWNRHQKLLYALVASEVRRYDPASRRRVDRFIRSSREGDDPGFPAGFPVGLSLTADGTVLVTEEATRSLLRHDPINALQHRFGLFGMTGQFQSSPRASALANNERLWVLERSARLSEFDLTTGGRLRAFEPRRAGQVAATDPTALAVDPDGGSLYLADGASDTVYRIDPDQPDQAEVFIAAGAGGLDYPAGLAFGPDGHLYVSSAGNDRILRFDGTSGAFIDVFSRAPEGVLRQPRALLFAPKVADRFPRDPARRFAPVAGGWYNPARSGHGFDIQRSGSGLAVVWYTYRTDGRPTWYLAVAPLQGDTWSADLLQFRWQDGAAVPEVVGSAELVFDDERRATFSWSLPEGDGSEPIQTLALGTSAETQFPTAAWYRPAESGWGLSLTRQGEVTYAMAFVYDADGEPVWFGGPALDQAQPDVFDMLWFDGPDRCPSCTGPANATPTPAGSLLFEPLSLDRGTLQAELEGGGVAWQREPAEFRRLTDTPTDVNGDPLTE